MGPLFQHRRYAGNVTTVENQPKIRQPFHEIEIWLATETLQNYQPNTERTSRVIRYFRVCRIVLHTLTGLFVAAVLLPFMNRYHKSRLIQWWCSRLLAAFNIKIIASGSIPDRSLPLNKVMFVANHISWSDVHALNSVVPVRFIAKSEIRRWPIFGYLVQQANTLFIDRNLKKDAKRIMDSAVESLKAGDNLCFFPEGTTTDGTTILPFKSSLIQAALEAEALIWPVAIHYPDTQNKCNTGVAYAGETSLTESMLNILSQQQPVVHLHFLEPVAAEAAAKLNRQALTQHIEHSIRQQLSL